MSKCRRFKVESLSGVQAGAMFRLPEDEYRHTRVLRLEPGTEIELFDGVGNSWVASLEGEQALLIEKSAVKISGSRKLILAVPWPKGKRAGVLVEKCSELGVTEIIPLRCARSVVHKDGESEGVTRLRRIAAEAAKQSGRTDTPEIQDETSVADVLRKNAGALKITLDPHAELSLVEVLQSKNADEKNVLMLIGPEGGFTLDEVESMRSAGCETARLGEHILRMETAAVAACSVWAAL